MPAVLMTLTFFGLAALVWPANLERLVSLQWRVGSLWKEASAASALLAILGVVSILARRTVNARVHRIFPTARHFFGSVALTAGSTLFTLGLVELVLWKLDLPFTNDWIPSETALAQFDPEIGWSYIPDRSAVQRFGSDQREVPMFFDASGLRVGTPGARHDPNAPTVILVGCSLTMGHGLPWDETFAGRLEATPGFPLQVVNLGVQGYGTDQALLLLRRHMKEFNTKAVVYTFAGDHVSRNANDDRRLLYPRGKFIGTKPLFGVAPGGGLVLRERPHRYQDVWEPRIWSYVRSLWARWGPVPDAALTRALVREMRAFVEANGATFILVRWPGSTFAFDAPGLREIDLGSIVPPGWDEWTIPEDGHPDARADAFVAGVLADNLRDITSVQTGKAASRR